MTSVAAGSRTDVGVSRQLNEDALLAEVPVFVVADGMGGHAAGEVASQLVVDQFRALIGNSITTELLHATLARANQVILDWTATRPSAAGMGTTVTGVALGEVGGSPHWFVFNVGDSRVYHYIDGALRQITIDHSEVEELVSLGIISADAARTDPRRNIVTRSLGTTPAPLADIWVRPAEAGETFVLCSDGLTNELSDDEISLVLARTVSPQRAADDLVAQAVRAGARDNVSVVVVMFDDVDVADKIDGATAPRGGLKGLPT